MLYVAQAGLNLVILLPQPEILEHQLEEILPCIVEYKQTEETPLITATLGSSSHHPLKVSEFSGSYISHHDSQCFQILLICNNDWLPGFPEATY